MLGVASPNSHLPRAHSHQRKQARAKLTCLAWPSPCSSLSWAKQLCHLPCVIALCLLHALPAQRDKHSSCFVWRAQIPCDAWTQHPSFFFIDILCLHLAQVSLGEDLYVYSNAVHMTANHQGITGGCCHMQHAVL